jgi:hypothetical protein
MNENQEPRNKPRLRLSSEGLNYQTGKYSKTSQTPPPMKPFMEMSYEVKPFDANCDSKQFKGLAEKMPNFCKEYDDLVSNILGKTNKIKDLITVQERKGDLTLEEQKIKNLTNTEEVKDFYEYTEDCMKRIVTMKVPADIEIEHLKLNLPLELGGKKLAIFDLDETLVHCEIKNPKKGDVIIDVKLPSGDKAKVNIL